MSGANFPRIDSAWEQSEASRRALMNAFAPAFVVREESRDFGIDGSIEVKSASGDPSYKFATNRRAQFQLKSVGSAKRNQDQSISFSIEISRLRYLLQDPRSFYVLFVADESQLYFLWCREIVDQRAPDGDWRAQKSVTARFSRRVDADLIREIGIEIDALSSQILEIRDGPGLIRSFVGRGLPDQLRPLRPFTGRHQEIDTLTAALGPGAIVPIFGSLESGKTQLVSHMLVSREFTVSVPARFTRPLAVLVIELGSRAATRRVFRGIARALGGSKAASVAEVIGGDRLADADAHDLVIHELLPTRLQGQSAIVVFDNAGDVLAAEDERRHLEDVLQSPVLCEGAAVVVADRGKPPSGGNRSAVTDHIVLGPLGLNDAVAAFLDHCHSADLALAEAVKAEAIASEKRVPGIVVRAASLARAALVSGSKDLDSLVRSAFTEASERFAQRLCAYVPSLRDAGNSNPATATRNVQALCAMAVFGSHHALPAEVLRVAGVLSDLTDDLFDYDLVRRDEVGARITAVGRAAAGYLLPPCLEVNGADFEQALTGMVDGIVTGINLSGDDALIARFAGCVESALTWTERVVPDASTLRATLLQRFVAESIDDRISPFSSARELQTIVNLPVQTLPSTLAALVTSSRYENDANRFVARLQRAGVAAKESSTLTASDVRVLDFAAALGVQRYRRYEDVFHVLAGVAPRVMELAEARIRRDTPFVSQAVSFLVNLAAASIGIGNAIEAERVLRSADTYLQRMPRQGSAAHGVSALWLEARVMRMLARLEADRTARVALLTSALRLADDIISTVRDHPRWLSFYVSSTERLVVELDDASKRESLANDAVARIAAMSDNAADPRAWALRVRLRVARLFMTVARMSFDIESGVSWLSQAQELLRSSASPDSGTDTVRDSETLLAVARSYLTLAGLQEMAGQDLSAERNRGEAARLARRAIQVAPSDEAWGLWLRLIDHGGSSDPEWTGESVTRRPGGSLPSPIRDAIREYREWSRTPAAYGLVDGSVAYWCGDRERRAEGDLERVAKSSLHNPSAWDRLRADHKQRLLKQFYLERDAALAGIERKFGPLIDVVLARARNEAQYRRLTAIHGNHICDPGPTLSHYERAIGLWPSDHRVLFEQARFYRYIWSHAEAIVIFRRLAVSVPSAGERREVLAALVETLLIAAIYAAPISIEGEQVTGADLIREARGHLPTLLGFTHVATKVAVLRDRVNLEAAEAVDWDAIDQAYERVVGSVDGFATTVGANIEQLRERATLVPQTSSDAVESNFTDGEVLRGLGLLYMRRAEIVGGPAALEWARRAYRVFTACRILEQAWLQFELPLTRYHRARALLLAIDLTRDASPFDASAEGKRTLLHLAESLLTSVANRTVGQFHALAREYARRASRLKKTLLIS